MPGEGAFWGVPVQLSDQIVLSGIDPIKEVGMPQGRQVLQVNH